VRKLAQEKIAPLVKKMDEEEKLDPSILPMYFENGVRLFNNFRSVPLIIMLFFNVVDGN
jgi:hypothetical protein